jgi:hypothetical protein
MKKSTALIITASLVFFIIMFSFLFLTKSKTVFSSEYKRLLDYCEESSTDSREIAGCRVFLKNHRKVDEGTECLDIILPTSEVLERELELCEDHEVINWENPYTDYSLTIPIEIGIIYRKPLFKKEAIIEKIDIEIMDDATALKLLETSRNGNNQPLSTRTEEMAKIESSGYHSTLWTDGESDNLVPVLVILRSKITSFKEEGNNLLLNLRLYIEEREIDCVATAERFHYIEGKVSEDTKHNVVDKSNISKILNLEKFYRIVVEVDTQEELEKLDLLEYLTSEGKKPLIIKTVWNYESL